MFGSLGLRERLNVGNWVIREKYFEGLGHRRLRRFSRLGFYACKMLGQVGSEHGVPCCFKVFGLL